MNALDLMKAIGEMPEEVIASCCFMKPNQITQRNTLVQPQLNETGKEDLPLQKESFVNSKLRRRDTMKQKSPKAKTAGRLLPWHIASGITAAACAILAVSVGIDVIERNSQMQVGTSMSTTTSKQNSERGPIEIASAEQTYAELELHENEKRICAMEQVDAIMESGYAEFKQNGRKTIDKDRYIALIHNGNRQADDLEIKSFIYHMMLNSIDYFNRAEGSMTYAIPKESPVEIDFQTDIALQECYESESESGEEIE